MEPLKKNRELAIVISSYPALVIPALFVVVSYKYGNMLTGDHLASAQKIAAIYIPLIVFSVMFGIALIGTLIKTLRLIAKTKNQGKVVPTEATTNTSLSSFYSNTKLVNILGALGVILQSIFIALSLNSGRLALVVFWGVMLGITLVSYLYLQSEIKRRKASANEAGLHE